MSQIHPNSTPVVGSVVIFVYKDKSGAPLPHYGILTALNEETFTVDENNYVAGVTANREVPYNDRALRGFWVQPAATSTVATLY